MEYVTSILNSRIVNEMFILYHDLDEYFRKCFSRWETKIPNKVVKSEYVYQNDTIELSYMFSNKEYMFANSRESFKKCDMVFLFNQYEEEIVESVFCNDEDITEELTKTLGPVKDFHCRLYDIKMKYLIPEKYHDKELLIITTDMDMITLDSYEKTSRQLFEEQIQDSILL